MAVDPFENWVALGTSLGYHVVWDMRFQLPIRHWQHTGHGSKSKNKAWPWVGAKDRKWDIELLGLGKVELGQLYQP